jgi:anthranilate synthase component 2
LGHQAIGEAFGGKLTNLDKVYHGVATPIKIINQNPMAIGSQILKGLGDTINVGRYHSWIVSKENFPLDELEITAEDDNGYIMAMQHKKYDVQGVQFHPESVLTPDGEKMMRNWLSQ